MSTEYSHSYKDYSYKSNRRPDYRFNKYQPKEITIYEPKNPNKNTEYQDENDYDNYKSYDKYDSRSNYRGYRSKRYQKDTRTCNHGFNLWKTDFVVKSTNPPAAENTETKDKAKEVVSKMTSESSSESGSPSSEKSTNIPTEGSIRSLDTLEFNEDSQGMKEKVKGTIDEILEEREEGDNVLKTEVSQETDESDEEKFSNIDLKVEKKLQENEFDYQSDVFDDIYDEKRKTEEEEERPAWEDVDTKQILEDVKNGIDFLSLYPQDIKASFIENEYKPEEVEDQQEEEEDNDVEEDFNTILALRVLERGFSRPSIEVNTGAAFNNKNYQESAKSDVRLPIIIESPGVIGCQSAFLPCNTPQYTYNNYPLTAQNCMFGMSGASTPYTGRVPIKPVFKNFAEDYDVDQWFYADSDGAIQGPFSSRAMDDWYIQGYFPMDMEINLRESRGFRTLRELVDIANQGGDFLLKMNEVRDWFNHYEAKCNNEEETFPPGIPISPRILLQNERKECQSSHIKRLAAFDVYNNRDNIPNSLRSSQSESGSPLSSGGIHSNSSHNSPVNNSFNPSLPLPFPKNNCNNQNGLQQQNLTTKSNRKTMMLNY